MRQLLSVLVVVFALAPAAAAQELVTVDQLVLGTAGCIYRAGSGSPEGVIVGKVCDEYKRTDTGVIYRKTSGTGNTGWTADFVGTVTSVALSAPSTSVFSVSGSPVTTSGTLTLSLANQNANIVFAGPGSGGATTPSFRSLVANDIPGTLNATAFQGHVTPQSTSTYDLGSSTLLWRNSYISQINATLFAKQTQTLYGGWLSVSKNAGTFAAAVASGDLTINFGQAMTANQFVLVRAADTGGTVTEEFIKVGTLVSGTTYNVTRNLSGIGAKNWALGTPYQVRGVAGDGWLELNAFDTPRMSVFTQGSLYNNSTESIRVGHLTGMPNSSSGIGMYMGDASNYVRWDGTNLELHSANTTLDSTGVRTTPTVGANPVRAQAYRFSRVDPTVFEQTTSDFFGVGATEVDTVGVSTLSGLQIANIMSGKVAASGGKVGDAVINIFAKGWDTSALVQHHEATIIAEGRPQAGFARVFLKALAITGTGSATLELKSSVTPGGSPTAIFNIGVIERSRTVPMGEWINVAYNGANFACTSSSWTVDLADQIVFRYMLVGKTMWIQLEINTADIGAACGTLTLAIPGGFSAATGGTPTVDGGVAFDGPPGVVSWSTAAFAQTPSGSAVIQLFRDQLVAWPATTGDNFNMRANFMLAIQ